MSLAQRISYIQKVCILTIYSLFHVEQNIIYTFISKNLLSLQHLQLQSDKEIRDTENQHCKNKIGYPHSDPDNAVELTYSYLLDLWHYLC